MSSVQSHSPKRLSQEKPQHPLRRSDSDDKIVIPRSKSLQSMSPDKTALLIDLDGTIITEDRTRAVYSQGISTKMTDFIAHALIGGNPVEIVTDGSFDHAETYHKTITTMIQQKLTKEGYPVDSYKVAISPMHYEKLKYDIENSDSKDRKILYFGLNARISDSKKTSFLTDSSTTISSMYTINPIQNTRPMHELKMKGEYSIYSQTLHKINRLFKPSHHDAQQNTETLAIDKVVVMGNSNADVKDAQASFSDIQFFERNNRVVDDKILVIVSLLPEEDSLKQAFFPKELTEHLDFSAPQPLRKVFEDIRDKAKLSESHKDS